MRARARYGRLVAVGGAAALVGLTFTPSTALAAPADKKFDVAKTGKIMAEGAAVKVKFDYTCPEGWQGGAGVTIVQAINKEAFASGYGGKNLKCSGGKQTASFFIQSNVYDGARPFQPGVASIVANLDAWNPQDGGCGEGMPCPIAEPEPAMGGGPTGKSSAMSALKEPSSMHRDFSGVITLS